MVVLIDPSEDPDDVLRANRSREKHFVFDRTFDGSATQVRALIVYCYVIQMKCDKNYG